MKHVLLFLLLVTTTTTFAQVTLSAPPDTTKPKRPIMMFVERMPQFPGGEDALQKFLKDNIKYPDEARKNKIEGKVLVKFVVNEDGSLTDFTVMRRVEGGCTEETLRVIKLMPRFEPGSNNGIKVPTYFILPVTFSLK